MNYVTAPPVSLLGRDTVLKLRVYVKSQWIRRMKDKQNCSNNNLLFKLLDEKIRGYQAAIFNNQHIYPENEHIKMWKRKKAYYERVKVIIEESVFLKRLEFDYGC